MKVTQAALARANTPIVGTMLVSEARKIEAAQRNVRSKFKQAALDFIKETEGRDIKAEVPNWTSYTVETDHRPRGTVTVRQYLHDERAPKMLTKTWAISKKNLVQA